VPCRAIPHPPRGCTGHRSKVADCHAFCLTYSSLVSPVANRSCTQ
jgi:hypothetical protein